MDPCTESADSLLATDLDGTALPVEEDPDHAAAVGELRRRLERRPGLCLAYVTGRSPDSARAAWTARGLPDPHALAADVGSQLLWADGGAWRPDADYAARARAALGDAAPAAVLHAVSAATRWTPQTADGQGPAKMSFRLDAGLDAAAELDAARAAVEDAGWRLVAVPSRCVFTGDALLDLLPAGADKAAAVDHVRRALGLDREAVTYAGDSGNDLAPLTAGFAAVVVGGAAAGLAEAVLAASARAPRPWRVHVSDRPHLHGLLEGARALGVL